MRALVVEDDPRIAEGMIHALKNTGFLTTYTTDGAETRFLGGTENFDLIVLDLGLPKLDGLTILKRWRQEGVTSPIIILTARGSWVERGEGIDAGVDDYLPKPFYMEDFLARVRVLIRRSAGLGGSTIIIGGLSLLQIQIRDLT